MAKVIESGADSVHLSQSSGFIWLTIGIEGKRGSRHTLLSPANARTLAYALLLEAERFAEARRAKKSN